MVEECVDIDLWWCEVGGNGIVGVVDECGGSVLWFNAPWATDGIRVEVRSDESDKPVSAGAGWYTEGGKRPVKGWHIFDGGQLALQGDRVDYGCTKGWLRVELDGGYAQGTFYTGPDC